MKQALEALEKIADEVLSPYDNELGDAILALRAAIEQAQEPVAWVGPSLLNPETRTWESESFAPGPIDGWIPLYTAPRQWQGLTEDEVAQAMYRADAIFTGPMQFKFAQAIEEKLKEKNT